MTLRDEPYSGLPTGATSKLTAHPRDHGGMGSARDPDVGSRENGHLESAVARLEKGEPDAKLSTVGRYAAALGKRLEWRTVSQPGKRRRAG